MRRVPAVIAVCAVALAIAAVWNPHHVQLAVTAVIVGLVAVVISGQEPPNA